MTQYAVERKESVVRRMLASPELSIRELSQETGISTWSLYDWRKKAIQGKNSVSGKSKPSGKQSSGSRRSAAQKVAVVAETAALNEAELAEYCRAKGLYPEEVRAWREAAEGAMNSALVPHKTMREARAADQKRIKELERELQRKERALAETAALLTLRKKAAAIWGEEEEQ